MENARCWVERIRTWIIGSDMDVAPKGAFGPAPQVNI